jgi:ubiquinone biosynthesis protein
VAPSRAWRIAAVFGRRWARAAARAGLGLGGRNRWAEESARETCAALEELGTTFVKIGQMVSVRPDVFPAELVFELSRLQDAVEPLSSGTVEQVIFREFGRGVDELFAWFDPEPTASASVAQVHRARLAKPSRSVCGGTLPAGAEVVVKVLRPGVEEAVVADIKLARRLSQGLRAIPSFRRLNTDRLLEEFGRSFEREVDLRTEGRVADRFAFDFREDPLVLVPRVVWSRTTRRVLTMEHVQGWPLSALEGARAAGVDTRRLAVHGATAFMRQVLVLGRFHADLHPANLFVTPDGRVAYLDFGIVGTLTPQEREDVGGMLAAIVFRDAESALARSEALGVRVPAAKLEGIRRGLEELMDRALPPAGRTDVRSFGLGFLALLGRYRIEIPVGYGLLVKALVTVEGVSRALYPEIDIVEVARPYVSRLMADRMLRPERLLRRLPAATRAALAELSA